MQYYILLDDSRCVNCPDSIIAVFDILEPFSEFRTGSGSDLPLCAEGRAQLKTLKKDFGYPQVPLVFTR